MRTPYQARPTKKPDAARDDLLVVDTRSQEDASFVLTVKKGFAKQEALLEKLNRLIAEAGYDATLVPASHADLWDGVDVPRSGVSLQPGQAEIHMLSAALPTAESAQYR